MFRVFSAWCFTLKTFSTAFNVSQRLIKIWNTLVLVPRSYIFCHFLCSKQTYIMHFDHSITSTIERQCHSYHVTLDFFQKMLFPTDTSSNDKDLLRDMWPMTLSSPHSMQPATVNNVDMFWIYWFIRALERDRKLLFFKHSPAIIKNIQYPLPSMKKSNKQI